MDAIVSTIHIPAGMPYLSCALSFVRELSAVAGFGAGDSNRMVLAAEEIITNVMSFGYEGDLKKLIQIDFRQETDAVSLVVHDRGMPFDPEKLPSYSPENAAIDSDLSGIGTFLAKKAMDEVIYRNHGRDGYSITLRKAFRDRHVENLFAAGESRRFDDSRRSDAPPPEYSIRRMSDDEAIEISKCAYKAYGYTYDDYIYYPEKIVSYNRNGVMRSLVAVTKDGVVMGHCAVKLAAAGEQVAELGAAFVKPEFRGGGIFAKMTAALFENCREMKLLGAYAKAVTSHTISQKICAGFDMKACAMPLAAFPADTSFEGLTGKARQRESSILFYYPFEKRPAYEIYADHRHSPMIRNIYGWLGIGASVVSAVPVSMTPPRRPDRLARHHLQHPQYRADRDTRLRL